MIIFARAACLMATLISFSCANQQSGKTETPKPAIQKSALTEKEIIEIAKQRYIRIAIVNKNGNHVGNATALRFSKNVALSNFHVLRAGCVTAEVDRKNNAEAIFQSAPANTLDDLIVFRPKSRFYGPELVLAKKIEQGETLIGYSNAKNGNGVLRKFFVSKVDEEDGCIYLDPPVIPGESGTGLFNSKGELAGIIASNLTDEITFGGRTSGPIPVLGRAISSSVIRAYLEETKKIAKK